MMDEWKNHPFAWQGFYRGHHCSALPEVVAIMTCGFGIHFFWHGWIAQ
jgi:hypothetical protein